MHPEAEDAIKSLQKAGFDLGKLSIVGKDYHPEEHVIGFYNAGDRMTYWGKLGAFWGGFWGLLLGAGMFLIPGIGPIMVLGPLATWIVGALENAVIGGGLSAPGAGPLTYVPKNGLQWSVGALLWNCEWQSIGLQP
jgi:hypothetical protein